MPSFEHIAQKLGATLRATTPLTGGVSARVTLLELCDRDGAPTHVVVREPGAALTKGHGATTARREHDLLAHLHRVGFPVPRPLLLVETEAPFFVMEHIDGLAVLPDDGPERMADKLAELHALPLHDVPAVPDREDPVARLGDFSGPAHAELLARVSARPRAISPRRALLHGDYWPGNVIWRDGAIAAVIDWEDAAFGDPLSDVACCRLELRYLLGRAGAEAFTARYVARTGVALDGLAAWDLYVAAAALSAMGRWGLAVEREVVMRREARASFEEAAAGAG